MAPIEKTIILLIVVVSAVFIFLMAGLLNEFDDCKGLQGVVDSIWTGEPCDA